MTALQKTKKITKQKILRSVASSSAIEMGLSTQDIELKLKNKQSKYSQIPLA